MESSLEIGFLRVTEKAAIAAARTMGYGKRKYSDQVAVESMREELNRILVHHTGQAMEALEAARPSPPAASELKALAEGLLRRDR